MYTQAGRKKTQLQEPPGWGGGGGTRVNLG